MTEGGACPEKERRRRRGGELACQNGRGYTLHFLEMFNPGREARSDGARSPLYSSAFSPAADGVCAEGQQVQLSLAGRWEAAPAEFPLLECVGDGWSFIIPGFFSQPQSGRP